LLTGNSCTSLELGLATVACRLTGFEYSDKLRQMDDLEKTSPLVSGPGLRQYFKLSLSNPILKYGSWMLFVLLVIRLTFIGIRGTPVPEVGEKASNYYIAPRTYTCQKPDPGYAAAADKVQRELSSVYAVNRTFLAKRKGQVESVQRKVVEALGTVRELHQRLDTFRQREKSGKSKIKESPFYKGEQKQPGADDKGHDPAIQAKETLALQSVEALEHIGALLGSVAPTLSSREMEAVIAELQRQPNLIQDVFVATAMCLEDIGNWYIIDTADQRTFTIDRTRGIVLADTGQKLSGSAIVYSSVEALDRTRGNLVPSVVGENFPRLKGNRALQLLVNQIAVASLAVNLKRDEQATEQAMKAAVDRVPRTVPVEYSQGHTIVAMGEEVQPWQRDCIARFSTRTMAMAEMGEIFGIAVPTLLILLGVSLLAVFASVALVGFSTRVFASGRLLDGKDYLAAGTLLILHLALVRLFLFLAGVFSLTLPELSKGTMLVACPVAMAVMVINLLMGARRALLGMLFVVLLTCIVAVLSGPELLSGDFPAYFALYLLIVNLVGIWGTGRISRRGSFFLAGLGSGASGALFWAIVYLLEGGQVPSMHVVQLGLASLASGALSYILLISLTPLYEYVWDYTTSIRLIELSSTDHPALKELSRRAPGTYQHSLWIAALVEDAAEAIGANPMLAKVGAYYHDLGKLVAASESGLQRGAADSPLFFAENQAMGHNPHDTLSPEASARILKKHVEHSIKMIRKYRLGQKVMDIAAQHHGTSLMEHFFNRALLRAEETGVGVDDDDFRYPGPTPQSREAALVMMGDGVEAAVRALPQHTEDKITKRVTEIVGKRVSDGQLDDSKLTFGDVKAITDSFVKSLVNMYHARPEYLKARPEEKTVRLKREEVGVPEEEDRHETRPMEREGPEKAEEEGGRDEPAGQ
jgi:putative nucleotidyltransferase with HDIG domain